jgi:L-amino acid ligase C-terminal domain 2/ATP-grasp domain
VIGGEGADVITHKVALRRRFAGAGVPQPQFAAVRTLQESRVALETTGLPAVLKPANAGRGRGLFLLRYADELESHLHAALAESPTQEAILERYVEGLHVLVPAAVHEGEVEILAACDLQREPAAPFVVAAEVCPTALFADTLDEVERVASHALHTLELAAGQAQVRIVASDEAVYALGVAARPADPLTAALVGASTPAAARFLTAEPGPLPVGTVRRVGALDKALAFPGVVDAEVRISVGDAIDPVRLDRDRRGHVVATGATTLEALERAEAASRLVDVEVW